MAQVFLDEHLRDFVAPLEADGHEVVWGGSPDRKGRSDAWQFRDAVTHGRVILTRDNDFGYLHRLWASLYTLGLVSSKHAGILTTAGGQGRSARTWLDAVKVELRRTETLEGLLLRWLPSRGQWVKDPWFPED